jgi:DNA-binding NtrC family response regulator
MAKRILVVVLDPVIREILQVSLESFGYALKTADNGRDALRHLEGETFAGMLLEVILPGINGIEILRKTQQLYPNMPVVMMTGSLTTELHNQVIAEGAKEVLSYPIGIERLQRVAERWFRTTV